MKIIGFRDLKASQSMDISVFETSEPFVVGTPDVGLLGFTVTLNGKKSLISISYKSLHEIADYSGTASIELSKRLFNVHREKLLSNIYDELLLIETDQSYLVTKNNFSYSLQHYK